MHTEVTHPSSEESLQKLTAIMVIFGGTGDLTHRKLIPALYNLLKDQLITDCFAIVAVGRKDKTLDEYIADVRKSLERYSRNKIDEDIWARLKNMIHYYRLDITDMSGYQNLKLYLEELDRTIVCTGNRMYYLAVAPQYFETIVHGLHHGGLEKKEDVWHRLVIEKPFGKDLKTAIALNEKINEVFQEKSIYRIDHYLGKEMIQNIMVLRFSNPVFESLWNNKFIDHVQITLSENLGVGTRGGYYEQAGSMRDMLQNHILQILTLVAMEPPVNLKMDSIRTEKQKVLESIEEFTPEFLDHNVVFGQYGTGMVDGKIVPGYREETSVSNHSNTETFVAMKMQIHNLRWAGTPFYIRTGKRLAKNSAEIIIQFKAWPEILYFKEQEQLEPNLLVLRIQPNVGVFFQFNTKDFSSHNGIIPTKMDTSYYNPMQGNTPEAYERLIYDVLRGDATLFSRWDEVEAAWRVTDQLIHYREEHENNFPNYEAGSMGPDAAEELLARDGRKWWNI